MLIEPSVGEWMVMSEDDCSLESKETSSDMLNHNGKFIFKYYISKQLGDFDPEPLLM